MVLKILGIVEPATFMIIERFYDRLPYSNAISNIYALAPAVPCHCRPDKRKTLMRLVACIQQSDITDYRLILNLRHINNDRFINGIALPPYYIFILYLINYKKASKKKKEGYYGNGI